MFSLGIKTFIFSNSSKNGVEETISEERAAFKASEPSPPITDPLPKKEAARPARPLLPLELPISGDNVTFTVYCLGILIAMMIPITIPTPAALYIVLRTAIGLS